MSDVAFRLTRRAALVLGAALLVAPAALRAQPALPGDSPPPPRIGNIWDNMPHQPTEADVGAAEQEMGLAGSPQYEKQMNKELEDLSNQLLKDEETDPAMRGH
jgi:hypothetical protein